MNKKGFQMEKFLVKVHVTYEKEIYVVANNEDDAKLKAENKEGIQVGLPKYIGGEKPVSVTKTKLNINI